MSRLLFCVPWGALLALLRLGCRLLGGRLGSRLGGLLSRRLFRFGLGFSLLRDRLGLSLFRRGLLSRLGLGLRLNLLGRRLGGRLRRLLAVGQDLGDAKRGQQLAMAFGAAVALTALLLENDDLVGALLSDDLGRHHGAGNGRAARLGSIATEQQHLAKLDDVAGLACDLLNLDNVVWRNAILLAARANDREHVSNPFNSWG